MIRFVLIFTVLFAVILAVLIKRKTSGKEKGLFVAFYILGFAQWISVLADRPLSPLKWIAAMFRLIGIS